MCWWQKGCLFFCRNNWGKNEGDSHAAGNLAGFRDTGVILHCLTIYPSLSKCLAAEVACLLRCLSELVLVILLCRPRGSADGSKEEIIPWEGVCWSYPKPLVSLWNALRAGISSPSSAWGACCATLTASGGQAPRGCDSATILERYSQQLGLQDKRICGKYIWSFRNVDCCWNSFSCLVQRNWEWQTDSMLCVSSHQWVCTGELRGVSGHVETQGRGACSIRDDCHK